jgi:hypothetical protein
MSLQFIFLFWGVVFGIIQPSKRRQSSIFPIKGTHWTSHIQRKPNHSKSKAIRPPIANKKAKKSVPVPQFNPHQGEIITEAKINRDFQFNPHIGSQSTFQNQPILSFQQSPSHQMNQIAPKISTSTNPILTHHHHAPPPEKARLISFPVDPSGSFCSDGIRVRKEFRDLTMEEWSTFKSTIIKMYEKDGTGFSLIDRIAKVHLDWADEAHYTPYFLLWHRVFTWLMETEMRRISPGITIPYWYWPYDAQNPNKSPIFDDFYLGTKTGPKGDCNWLASYPEEHCLVRNYKSLKRFYSEKTVNKLVYNKNLSFAEFAKKFEIGPHGIVHTEIGGKDGDMTDMASPYDPIFWLHHSQVEKIFLEWQIYRGRIDEFGGEHFGRKTKLTDYLKPFNISVADALDHSKFCTSYQPFSRLLTSPRAIKDLNQADEGEVDREITNAEKEEERMPIGELPISWIQMLGIDESEARAIEAELRSYEEEVELKNIDPNVSLEERKATPKSFKIYRKPSLPALCVLSIPLLLGMIGITVALRKRSKTL